MSAAERRGRPPRYVPGVEFVSARQLERARRRGARLVGDPPEREGWWLDEKSAELVLSLFGRLRVSPAFRLVTSVSRDGIGGTGWTFAIPAGAAAAPLEDLVVAEQFQPKAPPGALGHFMEAVVGDGSLRSYVQAWMAGREIAELGAWWHGLEWATHGLVGPSDEPGRPAVYDGSLHAVEPVGMFDATEWRWSEKPPDDWRPRAERDGYGAVTVTFWSYSELGSSAVYEHRDVYGTGGSLAPVSVERRELGSGPGGYVF